MLKFFKLKKPTKDGFTCNLCDMAKLINAIYGRMNRTSTIKIGVETMGNKITAVVFDLDGVICHTDKYHYLAWKELADELDIYFDETINNRLRGVSRIASFEIILERYNGEMTEQEKEYYSNQKDDIYRGLLQQMSPADLDPEVKSTLIALREKGYKLAIGSSSRNTPLILEKIGLNDFFDAISDGNNITNSKPHPEVFLKAAEYLAKPAEQCLVVEDAVVGVEAAHAAGMPAAAIGDAAGAGTAEHTLGTFADLLLFL